MESNLEEYMNRNTTRETFIYWIMAMSGYDYKFVSNIDNLSLALKWVERGYDLVDFYLLEQNNCDLELAFEMKRILDILKH